jgi:DNA modification methylase
MWVDIIENYSKVGVIIYESFSGSGTTLIACERLGRKCRAVEISPAYCAIAIQRWVDMTGGEPVLLGTQT